MPREAAPFPASNGLSARHPIRTLRPGEPEYPVALQRLPSPPELEWSGAPLPGPVLAIVGSRRASPEALRFTRQLAAWAAGAGITVLSGGALGVDAAAHEGALDGGGRTGAVLVGPLERPAPARHRALFRRVLAQDGSLLAPLHLPRSRAAFVVRNLYVAALADHVVVVQAAAHSGSVQTGRHALGLGRPLWAVPGAPWSPGAEGCLALLASGARMLTGPAELAAAMNRTPPSAIVETCPKRAWLRAHGEAFPDELARALGLEATEVRLWVSREELEGRLGRSTQGRIRLLGA